MKCKIITALIFILLLTTLFNKVLAVGTSECPDPESSCTNSDINARISCLEDQESKCNKSKNSLQGQINYINTQINLNELNIKKTIQKIDILETEISNISAKIDKLEVSLSTVINVLISRVIATYKIGTGEYIYLILSSKGFSDLMVRTKYIKSVQEHDKKLLFQMQETKNNYVDQKQERENKKKELDILKITLAQQKTNLENQQQAKKNLLEATKNNEATYQNLLEKARKELAAFSAFTVSAGGGETSFGNGSNGWYYTQRDPQWGNMVLPGSSSSVLLAGCAVTSVAMVCRSYGQNTTPASIVSNSNNFIYGDLWNWAFNCSGKSSNWIGSSRDDVKNYVKNNTPVILRIIAPSVSGLHFIVAFAWDENKSDFMIHDPYYGPDKYFSERYSWSQVTSGVVIY